jgi:hypothetical protein
VQELLFQPVGRTAVGECGAPHFGPADRGAMQIMQFRHSRCLRPPADDTGRDDKWRSAQAPAIVGKTRFANREQPPAADAVRQHMDRRRSADNCQCHQNRVGGYDDKGDPCQPLLAGRKAEAAKRDLGEPRLELPLSGDKEPLNVLGAQRCLELLGVAEDRGQAAGHCVSIASRC